MEGKEGNNLPINWGKPTGVFDPYWMAEARRSMRGKADLRAASPARSPARISWSCERMSGLPAAAERSNSLSGFTGGGNSAGEESLFLTKFGSRVRIVRTNPGTGAHDGRRIALPKASQNCFIVTESGATTFTAPLRVKSCNTKLATCATSSR